MWNICRPHWSAENLNHMLLHQVLSQHVVLSDLNPSLKSLPDCQNSARHHQLTWQEVVPRVRSFFWLLGHKDSASLQEYHPPLHLWTSGIVHGVMWQLESSVCGLPRHSSCLTYRYNHLKAFSRWPWTMLDHRASG